MILITESWCNKDTSDISLNLDNYNLEVRVDRSDTINGCGGGLLVYAKVGLTVILKKNTNKFNQFCDFVVLAGDNTVDLNFSLIYRPPNSSKTNIDLLSELFYTYDNDTLSIGDFNFPSIDWSTFNSDNKTQIFVDAVLENDFTQLIDFPTHIRGNILDLALTNCPERIVNIEDIGPIGNSDHNAIILDIVSSCKRDVSEVKILDWSKANIKAIKDELEKSDIQNKIEQLDTNDGWNLLKNVLSDSISKYVPTKVKNDETHPKWASKNVYKLSRKKRQKWAKYCENRTDDNLKEYKIIEKKCKKAVRQSKRNFEKKIANSDNVKSFYSYVRNKTKSKCAVGPLKINNNVISDSLEMAQNFNSYFATVFTRDDNVSVNVQQHPNAKSMLKLAQITPKEVKEKIINLKKSHSSGPDNITSYVLKTFSDNLCKPLSVLYNKSINSNTIPEDWKFSNVVPIHKKGSKGDPSNYRPISLTSIPCKIIESIIKDKVVEHIERFALMKSSQFGFTKGKSTVLNIIEFLDKFVQDSDDNIAADFIYLDFSKAFDKVAKSKLISKLKALNLEDRISNWIENWLSGRKQRVVVNGMFSDWIDVLSGIGQGSCLGPLLFIIFIDDIDDVANFIDKLRKFADDTKVGNTIKTQNDCDMLQKALDNLWDWSLKWKMEFNVDKCKVMHIGGNFNLRYKYKLNGHELSEIESEKDLGVWCSNDLKPSVQCIEAARKANSALIQISKSFHFRDRHVFRKLYISYVRVHLEYAVSAWSPFREADIQRLEKVQEKFVKMISGLKGNSYEEKLKELRLPTLKTRRIRTDMIQVFKIVKGIDKIDCSSLFTFMSQSHPSTRNAHPLNLVGRHCKKDTTKNFFTNRVVNLWNNLPNNLKDLTKLKLFKYKLDEYLSA